MSSEKTKWWKTPPYSNIVGGLIVTFVSWIVGTLYRWYTTAPILSTIGDWLKLFGSSFTYVLNFEIKFWWLFVISLITTVLHLTYKIYKQNKSDSKLSLPVDFDITNEATYQEVKESGINHQNLLDKREKMLNYTADKFLNYTWEWKWVLNTKISLWEPKSILPCCQTLKCNQNQMDLQGKGFSTSQTYFCYNCMRSAVISSTFFSGLDDEITTYIMAKTRSF